MFAPAYLPVIALEDMVVDFEVGSHFMRSVVYRIREANEVLNTTSVTVPVEFYIPESNALKIMARSVPPGKAIDIAEVSEMQQLNIYLRDQNGITVSLDSILAAYVQRLSSIEQQFYVTNMSNHLMIEYLFKAVTELKGRHGNTYYPANRNWKD